MPGYRPLGPKTTAPASFSLLLSSKKNLLILARDGREVGRCAVNATGEWRAGLAGVLQRGEGPQAQSHLNALVIRQEKP